MSHKTVPDADWIYEENLNAFLTVLSWFIDYAIHPDEYIAVEHGVKDTFTDKDRWFDYYFEELRLIKFRIGKDEPGTRIIMVKIIEAPKEIVPKIQAAIEIMQNYELRR